jgi:hypothetical protein
MGQGLSSRGREADTSPLRATVSHGLNSGAAFIFDVKSKWVEKASGPLKKTVLSTKSDEVRN